jgi:hypothetical protein
MYKRSRLLKACRKKIIFKKSSARSEHKTKQTDKVSGLTRQKGRTIEVTHLNANNIYAASINTT